MQSREQGPSPATTQLDPHGALACLRPCSTSSFPNTEGEEWSLPAGVRRAFKKSMFTFFPRCRPGPASGCCVHPLKSQTHPEVSMSKLSGGRATQMAPVAHQPRTPLQLEPAPQCLTWWLGVPGPCWSHCLPQLGKPWFHVFQGRCRPSTSALAPPHHVLLLWLPRAEALAGAEALSLDWDEQRTGTLSFSFLFKTANLLCCPGWPQAPGLKGFCLSFLMPAKEWSFLENRFLGPEVRTAGCEAGGGQRDGRPLRHSHRAGTSPTLQPTPDLLA